MKTAMRREVDKGIADKLLLNEASMYQILRQVHRNHKFQLVECFVVAFVLGVVLGGQYNG